MEQKHGFFTARYCQDLIGLKARIIHECCRIADWKTMPDGRIVPLFDLDEVRKIKRERAELRERTRRSRELMAREGRQLCLKCGAIIPWPGIPYCRTPECLPPSLKRRLFHG